MNKKINVTSFSLIVLFLLQCFLSSCYAETLAPEKLLRQVTDEMIARLKKDNAKIAEEPNYVYDLANEILVPHADFHEMARRVLGTNWRKANENQQQRFEEQFKILVIRTYAAAFRKYKDEQVEIVKTLYGHTNKDLVEVDTLVKQTSGPDIVVNYRMIKKDGAWKVYDLNVEGVSLISSFSSQFNESIRTKGLNAVIDDITERNKKGLTK